MMQTVLDFWFPNENYQAFWFDRSKDDIIIKKYSTLLLQLEKGVNKNESLLNKMAMIIVLDQFSRTIYRENIKIVENTKIAVQLSNDILENELDQTLPDVYRIFLLLPYRHLGKSDALDAVLEKINEYDPNRESKLWERFRYATYQSYTECADRIHLYSSTIRRDSYEDVIDPACCTNTNIKNNKISDNPLYRTLRSFFRPTQMIAVSLSGGVDSMVILFLLSLMKEFGHIKGVYAMHLEYGVDEYTKKETAMMGECCELMSVPLYVRTISYLSREIDDRDFYESETKKVRFHTYRYLSEQFNISGWCLGHHRGDVSENVMMNLLNGRDILDLTVMEKETIIHGTCLFRPLLDHPKSEIYQLAHAYQIPYLRDSTPDWSCRGVLRRKVMPILEDQWGNMGKRLIEIGEQSKEWNSVIELFVLEPIKKQIIFGEEIVVPLSVPLPRVIWVKIFLYVFHTAGVKMISRKNLDYFVETYDVNIRKKNRFNFSNGSIGYFSNQLEIKL